MIMQESIILCLRGQESGECHLLEADKWLLSIRIIRRIVIGERIWFSRWHWGGLVSLCCVTPCFIQPGYWWICFLLFHDIFESPPSPSRKLSRIISQKKHDNKGIRKASCNPLLVQEGGYGKSLGNKAGVNFTNLLKIKFRDLGIRRSETGGGGWKHRSAGHTWGLNGTRRVISAVHWDSGAGRGLEIRKLKQYMDIEHIQTVWGIGYQFAEIPGERSSGIFYECLVYWWMNIIHWHFEKKVLYWLVERRLRLCGLLRSRKCVSRRF